jgi:hypothetical protein
MSTRVCFVDLDGIVADATERFARADIARSLYLAGTDRPDKMEREAEALYWNTALDPDLIELDTLINGAHDALDLLADDGYRVIFLTSRPESMRAATISWLHARDLLRAYRQTHPLMTPARELVMKAEAFRYVKTVTWKGGLAHTLAAMFGAEEVLFVDDEAAHAALVMNQAQDCPYKVKVCSSLALAVQEIEL